MRVPVFHSSGGSLHRIGACITHGPGIDGATAGTPVHELQGTFEIGGGPMTELQALPNKKLIRVSEAAAYFGVHERTIRLWVEHGKLTAVKPTGTIFILRESIENFHLSVRPE